MRNNSNETSGGERSWRRRKRAELVFLGGSNFNCLSVCLSVSVSVHSGLHEKKGYCTNRRLGTVRMFTYYEKVAITTYLKYYV